MYELKRELLSQNRFQLFETEQQKSYLYDAFSQNIFPIEEMVSDFIFSESEKTFSQKEKEKITECLQYFSKWNGTIQYGESLETHLTINLSNSCNLNCTYCYRDKKHKNEMDLDKVYEIIEYADKYYKTNNNEIIFTIDMTAEPFLDKEKIKAMYARVCEYKDHQKMRIWFMSNGTKITDDYIDFIKEIPINPFWISLDGPKEVHNANRQYHDGSGSYNDVVKNIEKLQNNDISVKISCVLTKKYPYPDKLFNYLKTLKVSAIQMCPVRNGCEVSLTKDSLIILKESYCLLYMQIFTEIMNKDFSSVILLKEDFVMQIVSILFNRCRQAGRCTWGQEVIIDFNGDMYPCLYVFGEKKYQLGNISEKKNSRDFLRQISVDERVPCKSCWARFLCGGTCHYNAIISKNSEFETDDIECELKLFLIKESIKMVINLMENNADMNAFAKALNE